MESFRQMKNLDPYGHLIHYGVMNNKKVNICQPGFDASCSLCCGSHEGGMSGDDLEALYLVRGETNRDHVDRPDVIPAPPAERTPCPWIGRLNPVPGNRLIGCLIYHDPSRGGKSWEKFILNTCRSFSCQARDTLDEQEIIYAARLCRDWFYYSLIIHLPVTLRALMKSHPDPDDVTPAEHESLQSYLRSQM